MEEIDNKNWMIADLHLHSKYSRATSPSISFENLVKWAKIKGLHLLGTGDFTHPLWFNEIKEKLKANGKGFYYYDDFPFVISGEISFIYTQGGKGRRIHLLVLVPNIEMAEKINAYLDTLGRRDYDGRPIFGISCEEFTKTMMEISKDIEIIPAHIWTPWYSMFGSKSGFDSLKECFGSQSENIHAIETGLSSDPMMNWRIQELQDRSIVSFSDSHSHWPFRLGREATVFDLKELSYGAIMKAIRTRVGIKETIEVSPFFGKYHLTGHRNCNISFEPEEAKKINNICPECKGGLTIGVAARVEELADRPEGYVPKNAIPFRTLLPLQELLAVLFGTSLDSKKVWQEYYKLIGEFNNEFNVLLSISKEELRKVINEKIADAILANRDGKIKVKGGYDGLYGVPMIKGVNEEQKGLTDFM